MTIHLRASGPTISPTTFSKPYCLETRVFQRILSFLPVLDKSHSRSINRSWKMQIGPIESKDFIWHWLKRGKQVTNTVFQYLEPSLDKILFADPELVGEIVTGNSPAHKQFYAYLARFERQGWYMQYAKVCSVIFRKASAFEKLQMMPEVNALMTRLTVGNCPYKGVILPKLNSAYEAITQKTAMLHRHLQSDFSRLSEPVILKHSNSWLYDYALHLRKWDVVAKMVLSKKGITATSSRMMSHLFVSRVPLKYWDNLDFQGGILMSVALVMVHKTSIAVAEKPEFALLKPFISWFDRMLNKALLFDGDDFFKRNILKEIKAGENLFLPIKNLKHATYLLLTKAEEGFYRLTLYNTGTGTNANHYCWPNSSYHQTFDVIDCVPKEDLLNEESWNALLMERSSTSMSGVYRIIRDVLGKNGKRQPPSQHFEDYQLKQSHGTCATAAFMAFQRHQTMLAHPGTPREKLAFFNLYKSHLLTAYYRDNVNDVSDEVREHVSAAHQKYSAEVAMWQKDNELLRYQAIRESSINLAKKWMLQDGDIPSSTRSDPLLAFAVARFDFARQTLSVWHERLNTKDPFILADELVNALQTQYRKHFLERMHIYLKEDKPWVKTSDEYSIEIMMDALKDSRTVYWVSPFVSDLIAHLKKMGNPELAEWITKFWETT